MGERYRRSARRGGLYDAGRRQGSCRDACVEHEGRAPIVRFERLERTRSRRRGRGARRRLCVAVLRSPLALAERSPHRRPWHDAVTPAISAARCTDARRRATPTRPSSASVFVRLPLSTSQASNVTPIAVPFLRSVRPSGVSVGRAPAREPGLRVDEDDGVGPRVERERARREGARHLSVRDGALVLPRAEIPDAELQVPDLKAAVASRDQQLAGGMCAGGEAEDVDDAVVARRRAAPSSNQSTVLRLSPGLSGRCS